MYTGIRRDLAKIRPSPHRDGISYVPRILFISIEALTRPFVQAGYFCRFELIYLQIEISKALGPNSKLLPEQRSGKKILCIICASVDHMADKCSRSLQIRSTGLVRTPIEDNHYQWEHPYTSSIPTIHRLVLPATY